MSVMSGEKSCTLGKEMFVPATKTPIRPPAVFAANPNTMYTKYKKLLAELGLPSIRFHDLRHSYATAMIENHVPLKTVSHMLGHADIGITADIYCDVINSHKEAAAIAETCFFNKNI